MIYLAVYFGTLYQTWILFLGCTSAYNAWKAGKLTRPVVVLTFPMLLAMLAFDFVFNVMCSIPFVELPWRKMQNGKRAWLLTLRCDFHISGGGSPYQQALARFICSKLLDPFEVGGHCKKV